MRTTARMKCRIAGESSGDAALMITTADLV